MALLIVFAIAGIATRMQLLGIVVLVAVAMMIPIFLDGIVGIILFVQEKLITGCY